MKTVTSRPAADTTTKARRGLSPPYAGGERSGNPPALCAAGTVRRQNALGGGEIDLHVIDRLTQGVLDGHRQARTLGMPHGQHAGLDAQPVTAAILPICQSGNRQTAQTRRQAAHHLTPPSP